VFVRTVRLSVSHECVVYGEVHGELLQQATLLEQSTEAYAFDVAVIKSEHHHDTPVSASRLAILDLRNSAPQSSVMAALDRRVRRKAWMYCGFG
jgi:hypothetical protein